MTSRLPSAGTSARSPSEFDVRVGYHGEPGLTAEPRLATVQVNIGLKCNLVCRHCHVNSSPRRNEAMDWKTMEAVLHLAERLDADTIDITGGAPEMHVDFRRFVREARTRGFRVLVRTNLTILLEPGYEDLPSFFKEHRVELVASLPCYLEENVDVQRGSGVYSDSVEALRMLNAVGYGVADDLPLTLIYNPVGPSLPPDQNQLQQQYRQELDRRFGIVFTRLHTITNIPIGRFRSDLRRRKLLGPYMETLREAYNPDTVEHVMCRGQVSVGWDGTLYDCDFNLALRWPVAGCGNADVRTVEPDRLLRRRIVTGDHCYACTAGAGSSCGGALV